MDKKLLKKVLSVPTYFGREERLREFLINFAVKNKIPVKVDNKGNVYLVKGVLNEGESYPCVVAHMDTVHSDQIPLIDENSKLIIHEEKINLGTKLWAGMKIDGKEVQTGIGGDDKAGVFICLEIIKKYDKIIGAFFVEEEFGCKGSLNLDKDILKDVGYFIQFDAPFENWCSFTSMGVQLFNKETFDKIKPTLLEFGVSNISNDPYTDVFRIKEKLDVVCMNFFAGYYKMHTNNEFVIVEHIEKAINFGSKIIEVLGLEKYEMINKNKVDYKFFIGIQKEVHNQV